MGQTSRDPLYKRSSAHRALVTALIDHFGLLHDYTRTLNPGFTTGLTLYVVIFQAFTINRPLDYALDSLGLNELSASIIVVLLISVPIFLLISTVAFIIMETRVKRRLDNLPDEVHAHSAWYTIYAYVYRFSFFVTEPATTGFVLSAWISSDSDYQTKRLVSKTVTIILTFIALLGNFQSAFYVYLVEGILPGNTILSATTKFHVLTLNLMQKVSMAADALSVGIAKYHPNKTYISLLSLLRCSASIVTLPFVYHDTYFFSHHGRFMMGSIHAIIVFVTCLISARYLYNRDSSDPESLLIPIFLASSGILKALWNISRGSSFKPIRPDNCTLSVIIEAAELTILINEDEDEESSGAAVLLAQVEANLSSEDKKFWRFHEKALDGTTSHSKAISFVLYLFKLQIQRQPGMSFILKLYLVYYIVRLRMSIYQVNIYLEDLNTAYSTMSRTVSLDSVKRLVIARLRDYSEGRLSFMNTFSSSYLIGMQAKPVSTALKDNNPNTQAPLPSAVSFYKAFDAFKAHKVLISYMNKAIDQSLNIYELNDKRNISNSLIHQYCSNIAKIKLRVREAFLKIEELGVLLYRLHYLPYGMFVDNLSNDRKTLIKMLKSYHEKTKKVHQNTAQFMLTKQFQNMSKNTVIFVVSANQSNLGQIVESTVNYKDVFDIATNCFQDRNVNDFLSPDFATLHRRMLKSLAKNHHRPYLDAVKLRYARITGHNVYTRVAMVTKVYPNMDAGINFISMMRNDDHGHLYLVVSERGTISGYSKEILEFLPQLPFLRDARLSALSEELEPVFASMVAEKLLEGKEVEHSAVELAMRQLGVEGEWRDGLKTRGKMVGMRLSTGGGSVNMNTSTNEWTVEGRSQSVRVQEAWVEVIRCEWEGAVHAEVVLHFWLQNEEAEWSKRSREKQREVQPDFSKGNLNTSPNTKNDSLSKEKDDSFSEETFDNLSQDINFEAKIRPSPVRKRTIAMARLGLTIAPNLEYKNIEGAALHRRQRLGRLVLRSGSTSETPHEGSSLSSDHKMTNKIKSALSKQKKQFIWKEIAGIFLVQVVVWSMCLYITVLLDVNFYKEMKNLMSLRMGILYFTLVNTNSWNLGISLFDEMLVKGGWLQSQTARHAHLAPGYHVDFRSLYNYQYYSAQNYSMTFTRHVYSFEWKYASRYFVNKADYTYQLSDYDNKTLVTKTYDFRNLYRVILGSIRRWHEYIARKDTIVAKDFDFYAIQDYLSSIGQGLLEKVATPTILLLMDLDFKNYSSLVAKTRLIIISAIIVSLILSNMILFIVYIVRNKITSLYMSFQKLSHTEVTEQQNLLLGLKRAVSRSIEYDENILEVFYINSKKKSVLDIAGQPVGNSSRLRYQAHKEIRVFSCSEFYGLLNFVVVLFVIMEIYNIIALNYLTLISKETNRKLDMLTLSRASMTGNAALHSVCYRIYALSIQQKGLGLSYYNRTQILGLMTNSKNSLDTQLRLIENQLDTLYEPYPDLDQVGWDKFRHSVACDYVNKPVFNLTQAQCESMASGFMAKTPSEMYRWFRLTIDGFITRVKTANETSALDLLQSREFTEYNFLRRVYSVPFIASLNYDFNSRVQTYNERVAYMTRNILAVLLVCSILVALILNIIGFRHMRRQVSIGLSSLSLLPRSSFSRNTYISLLLRRLY